MKCPYCGSNSDKVVDSRSVREGRAIRRRRECLDCGRRFTTYEFVEESQLLVIKKDGRREPFDRGKIISGLQVACRKRPVSAEQIESVANQIEAELIERGSMEIKSTEIGEMVMARLKDIDQVAYVRFASVYRQFKDVDEFRTALHKLLEEKKK
ncbi:transcriptional regulator NrdR [bacterium]|nr:MAG: transcriptional regulator NrdR [bacterium]